MDNCAREIDRGLRRRGPVARGASVFLALSLLLPGPFSWLPAPAARAAEFEINASSFTTDNQVNMSSVTYYGGMLTTPANPSVTQLLNTPGGLYFDGARYRVWDNPTGAWVSLTTGTAGGLLPWSELTSFPGMCTGGQVVTGVGPALTCTTPSGTLTGGTAGYYGEWTGGATMGVGNLVDGGAGVTMIAGSTLTVSGNAFSVGASTFVVTGGSVGIGTTAPGTTLDVSGDITAHADAGGQGFRALGRLSDNFTWAPLALTNNGGTYTGGMSYTAGGVTIAAGSGLTNVMTWLPSGNVGIGTTSPVATLEVAGQVKITGGAPVAGNVLTSDAAGLASWQGVLPAGMVSFFNLATCPAGWTELTAARGRYLVGLPSGGTLGGTDGTALSNLEDRPVGQHSHTINDPGHSHSTTLYEWNGSLSGSGTLFYSRNSNATDGAQAAAPGTASATTGITINNSGLVAGTNAPYMQLLVCQKN